MEHIVQFAIGIDDEAIKKRCEESAYDSIIKQLTQECKEYLIKNGYGDGDWYASKKVDWVGIAMRRVDSFIENNRDAIIEAAANKLADSIKRTKAYKEKNDGGY